MINLSIDAADMEGQFDPTVNEIESLIELVCEVVLDQGNVISEQDEPDPESETCFLNIDHIIPSGVFQLKTTSVQILPRKTFFVFSGYSDPFLTILSPPPQV